MLQRRTATMRIERLLVPRSAVRLVGNGRHLDAGDDLTAGVDDVEVVHAIGAGNVTPDDPGRQEQRPDDVRRPQLLGTLLPLRHARKLRRLGPAVLGINDSGYQAATKRLPTATLRLLDSRESPGR